MGKREDTTERILAAGMELLEEDGFAALGVNTLARRAGADKQLIYRYFGGLDGVLQALGQAVAQRLADALATASGPAPLTYADMVEALALALLHHLREDRQYRQLRLMEVAAPTAATAEFAKARGAVLSGWVQARATGIARPDGRDEAALNAVLIAAVEGLAIFGPVGLDHDASARQEAALRQIIGAVYR